MPRQPFLPKYSKADLIYGPAHIPKKPKIAEAIGRCIMTWSYVDWQMAVLLAALMKANSEASIAIFLTLRNARAQREVLVAAADMTLTGSSRETFDAIMLLYAGLQSQRADLAHGIFGIIPDGNEDEIPWIETKNLSKEWIDKVHKPRPDTPSNKQDEKIALKRNTSVYRLSDLERLESDITDLWGIAFAYTSYLNYPDLPMTAEEFKKRCGMPLMVQALSQIRKTQKNSSNHPT